MSAECPLCGHDLDDHVQAGRGPECFAVTQNWTGAGDSFPDECGCPGPTWHQSAVTS